MTFVAALLLSTIVTTGPASADNPVGPLPHPEAFVTQQYLDFLGREPDPEGLAYWSGLIEQGTPAGDLVDWMTRSDEFGSVVAPLIRLYFAFFDRVPDYDGLRYWMTQVRGGVGLDQVAQQFTQSAEFQRAYGQLDDEAYVDLVYGNVMGRPADAEGAQYWLGQIQQGLARGSVMVAFSDSSEYRTKVEAKVQATMLYVGVLSRRPDSAGLDYWASVLTGGASYGDAIAGFLNSTEYRARMAEVFAFTEPLTGVASRAPIDRPALAVKIDNVDAARPQTSLDRADIIVEEMVEGNLTRLFAVFHHDLPTVVGPVRSIRTTDIHLLDPLHQPLLAASGANPGVLAVVDAADVVNVNALQAGAAYFRSSSRSAPHNLYATTAELYQAAQGAGGRPTPLFAYRQAGQPATVGATGVSADIAFGRADIAFDWSSAAQGWVRSQNGSAHRLADGSQLAPDNVVILEVSYVASTIDAQSPEAQTVGSGTAWVLTDGRAITGTWQRSQSDQPFDLRDLNGETIELTRGQTFVELAPPGTTQLS